MEERQPLAVSIYPSGSCSIKRLNSELANSASVTGCDSLWRALFASDSSRISVIGRLGRWSTTNRKMSKRL